MHHFKKFPLLRGVDEKIEIGIHVDRESSLER